MSSSEDTTDAFQASILMGMENYSPWVREFAAVCQAHGLYSLFNGAETIIDAPTLPNPPEYSSWKSARSVLEKDGQEGSVKTEPEVRTKILSKVSPRYLDLSTFEEAFTQWKLDIEMFKLQRHDWDK